MTLAELLTLEKLACWTSIPGRLYKSHLPLCDQATWSRPLFSLPSWRCLLISLRFGVTSSLLRRLPPFVLSFMGLNVPNFLRDITWRKTAPTCVWLLFPNLLLWTEFNWFFRTVIDEGGRRVRFSFLLSLAFHSWLIVVTLLLLLTLISNPFPGARCDDLEGIAPAPADKWE